MKKNTLFGLILVLLFSGVLSNQKLLAETSTTSVGGVKIIGTAFFPRKISSFTDKAGKPVTCKSQIPLDYGENFIWACGYGDEDYWAGAMYECKNKGGHLASPKEIAQITNAIFYKKTNKNEHPALKGGMEGADLTAYNMDFELANKIGLRNNKDGSKLTPTLVSVALWTSQQRSEMISLSRAIGLKETNWGLYARNSKYAQGICVAN